MNEDKFDDILKRMEAKARSIEEEAKSIWADIDLLRGKDADNVNNAATAVDALENKNDVMEIGALGGNNAVSGKIRQASVDNVVVDNVASTNGVVELGFSGVENAVHGKTRKAKKYDLNNPEDRIAVRFQLAKSINLKTNYIKKHIVDENDESQMEQLDKFSYTLAKEAFNYIAFSKETLTVKQIIARVLDTVGNPYDEKFKKSQTVLEKFGADGRQRE